MINDYLKLFFIFASDFLFDDIKQWLLFNSNHFPHDLLQKASSFKTILLVLI